MFDVWIEDNECSSSQDRFHFYVTEILFALQPKLLKSLLYPLFLQ